MTAPTDILPHRDFLLRMAQALRARDPEDLVQSTMLKALEATARGAGFTQRPGGPPIRAWLATILRNTHYTTGRTGAIVDQLSDLIPLPSVPGAQFHTVELREITAHLARLAPEAARAIALRALGHPYEEIAEIMGRELGTIKSQISRGRTALVRMGEGGEPPGARGAAPGCRGGARRRGPSNGPPVG